MYKTVYWETIEKEATESLERLIFRSEQHFDNQVDDIVKSIYEKEDVRIIMIAGPSSSGKTTFSKLLSEKLQTLGVKTHYIGLDDFFIDREKVPILPSGLRDFDSLRALDMTLLNSVIGGVLKSEWVEIPEFDFLTGKRKKEKNLICLHPEDVVVIEGIHALNPYIIKDFEPSQIAKIAIEPQKTFIMPSGTEITPDELRLLRRSIRDLYTRGHDFDATARQWEEVRKAESKYILPFLCDADYNVDSAHDYELFVYKQCLSDELNNCNTPLFNDIKKAFYEIGNTPITDIPSSSLLNEFAIAKPQNIR